MSEIRLRDLTPDEQGAVDRLLQSMAVKKLIDQFISSNADIQQVVIPANSALSIKDTYVRLYRSIQYRGLRLVISARMFEGQLYLVKYKNGMEAKRK